MTEQDYKLHFRLFMVVVITSFIDMGVGIIFNSLSNILIGALVLVAALIIRYNETSI